MVDEDLNRRLATELERRGRPATTIPALQLRGADDTPVLDTLTKRTPQPVLVTGDMDMPRDHADALARSSVAVCIVAPPPKDSALTEDEWYRELVHRWIHRMVEQAPATAYVYGARGRRRWTLRGGAKR